MVAPNANDFAKAQFAVHRSGALAARSYPDHPEGRVWRIGPKGTARDDDMGPMGWHPVQAAEVLTEPQFNHAFRGFSGHTKRAIRIVLEQGLGLLVLSPPRPKGAEFLDMVLVNSGLLNDCDMAEVMELADKLAEKYGQL